MTADPDAWVRDVAYRLRIHQSANRYTVADPEQEAVRFVLRALAEGGCPATAAVLEHVDRIRATKEPA